MDRSSYTIVERSDQVLNWEDGYTYDDYEAEQERLHRLYKRQQLEEERADWEEKEDEYTL